MEKNLVHLPTAELELMMAIWACEAPATRAEIEEKLSEKKWAATTVLKFLSRLTEKGFLSCESMADGKKNRYAALVSEEEYLAFESSSTMGKLCGRSVRSFIANLYENKTISDEDLSELQSFLDEAKGKESRG